MIKFPRSIQPKTDLLPSIPPYITCCSRAGRSGCQSHPLPHQGSQRCGHTVKDSRVTSLLYVVEPPNTATLGTRAKKKRDSENGDIRSHI